MPRNATFQWVRSPPLSVDELVARALTLEGRRLGDLANDARFELGPGGVRSKGKPGALLEALLGATGGSSAVHDFAHLGVELKSLPVGPEGMPLESTYVCRVPLGDAESEEWETSWVRSKLSRVLFVPIVARERKQPFAERRVGHAFLWTPSPDEDRMLRADFEDIMGAVALGAVEHLTAHVGQLLQCRPKAADGSARTRLWGPEGESIDTIPRGFYLRPSFTRGLLERARPDR